MENLSHINYYDSLSDERFYKGKSHVERVWQQKSLSVNINQDKLPIYATQSFNHKHSSSQKICYSSFIGLPWEYIVHWTALEVPIVLVASHSPATNKNIKHSKLFNNTGAHP